MNGDRVGFNPCKVFTKLWQRRNMSGLGSTQDEPNDKINAIINNQYIQYVNSVGPRKKVLSSLIETKGAIDEICVCSSFHQAGQFFFVTW